MGFGKTREKDTYTRLAAKKEKGLRCVNNIYTQKTVGLLGTQKKLGGWSNIKRYIRTGCWRKNININIHTSSGP